MYTNTKEQHIGTHVLKHKGTIPSFLPPETLPKLLTHLIPEVGCIFFFFINIELYVEEQNFKLLTNKQTKLPKLQIFDEIKFSANATGIPQSLLLRLSYCNKSKHTQLKCSNFNCISKEIYMKLIKKNFRLAFCKHPSASQGTRGLLVAQKHTFKIF